jgi:thymidylate kinase
MIGKLIVITGLDGSGTSSLAEQLCKRDPHGVLVKTPDGPFGETRLMFDSEVRERSQSAHYLFYLAAVAYASERIREQLKTRNVYCVRYLIDTVVSHRVAGMNVELAYQGMGYDIHKPDATLFISIDESVRQDRITSRGKSDLDKVLDNHDTRSRFLAEFQRFADQYYVIDNSTNDLQGAVLNAITHLPWLN